MAKNLANCTPKEFMVQTRLIKHSVEKWLTDTDIMNIRKTLPDLPDDLDDEEKKKRMEQQAKENLSKMFDAIAEEHPDETVELLGLLCFVPLDETNDHPMNFYFESITELLNDQSVWSFFSSLVMAARRLGITQA
jgi:5-methylcytosine-specific restriction endonuclease McrBC regulatory subunit McrC